MVERDRERKRKREGRERERERERGFSRLCFDRETEREIGKLIERVTDRRTEIKAKQTDVHINKQTDSQTKRKKAIIILTDRLMGGRAILCSYPFKESFNDIYRI